MSVSEASHAAYRAGKSSGDTGLFNEWADSKGLSDRGSWLRASYEAGVTGDVRDDAPAWLKKAAKDDTEATRRTLPKSKDVTFKGYRIWAWGDGFKSSIDPETTFDTVDDAKRFIADEVKMRRNPGMLGTRHGRQTEYRNSPLFQSGRKIGLQDRKAGREHRGDLWLRQEAERRFDVAPYRLTEFRDGYNFEFEKRSNPLVTMTLGSVRYDGEQNRTYIEVKTPEFTKTYYVSGRVSKAKALSFVRQRVERDIRDVTPSTRRNSGSDSDRLYEAFHGKPPDKTVIIEEEHQVHEHLATLGDLIEIRVDCETGIEALLSFEDDPPFLTSSEDGKQLYIEGGNQELDLDALGFTDVWIKDRMMIGRFSPPGRDTRDGKKAAWNIGYQTEKKFDGFKTILYQHDLGEETSVNGKKTRIPEEDRVRPYLEYDPRNQRLYVTGGQYFITIPVVGVSPGIEH